MSSPLSKIDDIVAQALIGFGPLTALVPAQKIQVWDRAVDIRGEVEDASDMQARIWVVPMDSNTDLNFSSGSVRFERHYDIGFGVGKLLLSQMRDIEWAIYGALHHLFNLKQPDGITIITQPDPLKIESIGGGRTDPERGPMVGDPQEWSDLITVTVVAFTARTNLNLVT